jgi:hypothetical protein
MFATYTEDSKGFGFGLTPESPCLGKHLQRNTHCYNSQPHATVRIGDTYQRADISIVSSRF